MTAVRYLLAALMAVVLAAPLTGCGETFDLADGPQGAAPITTIDPLEVPIAADATLDVLFDALLASWRGLDQRVTDGDRATEALQRIDSIWAQAEPILRQERPMMLFGFEQAIDLARSSVDRRRPGDANKGLMLASNLIRDWRG